eukprot:scaffold142055_cov36-Tisochrysis_lutea.AAC.2
MRHLSHSVPLGSHVPGGEGRTGSTRGVRFRRPLDRFALLCQKFRHQGGLGHTASSYARKPRACASTPGCAACETYPLRRSPRQCARRACAARSRASPLRKPPGGHWSRARTSRGGSRWSSPAAWWLLATSTPTQTHVATASSATATIAGGAFAGARIPSPPLMYFSQRGRYSYFLLLTYLD